MTPVRLVVALILGALPEAVSSDLVLGHPLHYRHRHPPPAAPHFPYHLPTLQRPPRTPPSLLARAPRPLHAGHASRPHPGDCPAGGPWVNVTDFGAPCLRWADVPPLLERSPPEGWAPLRGQRHNFCRSPGGAGRPWCFYRNARGRGDWGYCDCRNGPASPALRLAGGGSSEREGRVELFHAGQWGTVCDDQWDDADAEVVCRQLGLSGVARAWTQAHFGAGAGPVLLDEVRCTGNELSLEQCPKSPWGEHNCGHGEDAGVSCTPLTDGVLRLAGGKDSREGRLEVYHAGQWGTVCDDGWTALSTAVACRQLGFKYGKQAPADAFEESRGPIWLDDVSCSGQEPSLLWCLRSPWGRHDCSHREDVAVACSPGGHGQRSPLGFPVRLRDGESKKEGRVEVFIGGQWGTVCDDGWTDEDAAVACRQLGYRGPARARGMAYFGEGGGPIHLDNVGCTGAEGSLADCVKQDVGRHNCRHSEDAGVICDYFDRKAPGHGDKGREQSLPHVGRKFAVLIHWIFRELGAPAFPRCCSTPNVLRPFGNPNRGFRLNVTNVTNGAVSGLRPAWKESTNIEEPPSVSLGFHADRLGEHVPPASSRSTEAAPPESGAGPADALWAWFPRCRPQMERPAPSGPSPRGSDRSHRPSEAVLSQTNCALELSVTEGSPASHRFPSLRSGAVPRGARARVPSLPAHALSWPWARWAALEHFWVLLTSCRLRVVQRTLVPREEGAV
ncbi:neurotrypsin isoform 2-T2 [Glossophaga mutica]